MFIFLTKQLILIGEITGRNKAKGEVEENKEESEQMTSSSTYSHLKLL
jgi:hypothetical protein